MIKKIPWKKIWNFIWHDDSALSWVVNIVLAFILIKYIVYPGLGLVFGAAYPVVAVVSPSMEHNAPFYEWWDSQEDFYLRNNITDIDFREYKFKNGFNKGDIIVLFGTDPYKIKVGDVIVYNAPRKVYPIIHRVIKIRNTGGELYFSTKGDGNKDMIVDIIGNSLDERNISSVDYLGRGVFRIPYLGYVKIWFVWLMNLIGLGGLFA